MNFNKILIVNAGRFDFEPTKHLISSHLNNDNISFLSNIIGRELDNIDNLDVSINSLLLEAIQQSDLVIFIIEGLSDNEKSLRNYLKFSKDSGATSFLVIIDNVHNMISEPSKAKLWRLSKLTNLTTSFSITSNKELLKNNQVCDQATLENVELPNILKHLLSMLTSANHEQEISIDIEEFIDFFSDSPKMQISTAKAQGPNSALDAIKKTFNQKSLKHSQNYKLFCNFVLHPDFLLIDLNSALSYIEEKLSEDSEIIFTTTIDSTRPVDSIDMLLLLTRQPNKKQSSTDTKVQQSVLNKVVHETEEKLTEIKGKENPSPQDNFEVLRLERELHASLKKQQEIQNQLDKEKQQKEVSKEEIKNAISHFKKPLKYVKDLVEEYNTNIHFFNLAGSTSLLLSAIGLILYIYELKSGNIATPLTYFSHIFIIVFPIIVSIVFFSLSSKKLKEKHMLNNKIIFIDNMEGILLAINELSTEKDQKEKTTEIMNNISNNFLNANLNGTCNSESDVNKGTDSQSLLKLLELSKSLGKE